MPLLLTAAHNFAIRVHAARDYPHECCGFLIGRTNANTVTVLQTKPAANTRDDSPRNRFEISPWDLMKADRDARTEGLGVVGFYHSHPDALAVPSRFDREHAWPGYCYIIVSVVKGQAKDMNNWLLREDRSGFDPDPITIQPTTQENTE